MVSSNTVMGVSNLLKASNYNFLDGKEAVKMFTEDVVGFTDEEITNGARNFIRNPGKYPNYPGLLDAIRTEHYARMDYSYKPDAWRTAVRCPKCEDRGYIFHYWKKDLGDGNFLYTETMRACNCSVGRERFPSLLQTQKERDEWTFEAARKGGNPTKQLFDYTEEQFREVVGSEISKSQYDKEFGRTLLYKATLPKPKEEPDVADLWKELANALG